MNYYIYLCVCNDIKIVIYIVVLICTYTNLQELFCYCYIRLLRIVRIESKMNYLYYKDERRKLISTMHFSVEYKLTTLLRPL